MHSQILQEIPGSIVPFIFLRLARKRKPLGFGECSRVHPKRRKASPSKTTQPIASCSAIRISPQFASTLNSRSLLQSSLRSTSAVRFVILRLVLSIFRLELFDTSRLRLELSLLGSLVPAPSRLATDWWATRRSKSSVLINSANIVNFVAEHEYVETTVQVTKQLSVLHTS